MAIRVKTSLTLDRTIERLRRMRYRSMVDLLTKYGELGLAALREKTPKKTGKTAASWSFDVHVGKDTTSLSFKNSNIQNGVCIAMVIEYGHATYRGGWVEGRPYIEEALIPIFDEMLHELKISRKGGKR